MLHLEASPTKSWQRRQDIERATNERQAADDQLKEVYDRLCEMLQVRKKTAAACDHDDGGFERQVRELTQDVLDAGDHYKASASTELELVRAQCTVAFHDMNIAKGMNQDLKTQVEVVEERLREYDTSAASDDMYEKKLQKLHDLQHQAKDTSDTIHRMRRTLEAKQKTLQEQEPAMEVWRQLAAEKERTDQTLKQIQAQLASVHRDQTVLARKHQLAVEKAERTMQYTRNQCDLARKDVRTR
ncbi:hypothetical protein, variant 2 [Aphanomyces astaci]|uniref:Uncharacterized protein n=1 Tax=Aphanomyces astaci TaxID=112090 RepID=W4GAT4_APHAT|nr:hypothetical protein, variant 2 [Aphanomyces astaci]ETV76780.1 hypothetical protein, variant 2 [Aphanomyces astaci]|eukprot:XP_009833692.1 hypothetical protein, variant 2 [Aphanomyces astaci]